MNGLAGHPQALAAGLTLLLASLPALPQPYPAKPVRLVVGGPPGGGADVVMRPIAQKLTEALGQQVVVDNRPGAGSMIAAQIVAGAPPDGHTLLEASASSFAISPYLQKRRPYDPVADFTPITLVATAPLIVAVHPALPVKTLAELVALAKSRPGKLLYGSNGKGSLSHLSTASLAAAAGIDVVHVPYKGGAPAVVDTVSGPVQLIVSAMPTVLPQVKAQRLRALAVTGSRRSAMVPELPPVAESGVPGFVAMQWWAVVAPKNTPAAIVERLYGELRKAADTPAVRGPLAHEGAELSVTGPHALADLLKREGAKWRQVIRDARVELD